MKGVWKIFEFELFDVLVSKGYSEHDKKYTVEICICPEIGNTATVSMKYDDIKTAESAFEQQTHDTVSVFADYIIESLGGQGIFEDGGPDEIEAEIRFPAS